MGLRETFHKQGGMRLIKQYIHSGSLGVALSEFLLLGKSRTALEILRLSTQLKVKKKLERKYRKTLESFDQSFDSSLEHKYSNKVWICWLQGLEQAPEIVKKCFYSVQRNLCDHEIILITSDNMNEYVQFPDYIIDKWRQGIITNTHITDLLRLELLTQYGGMWLDATVFCSSKSSDIPDFFFNSDLFFYQSLKPGRDGKSIYFSSWLMSAKSNTRILLATKELCYEYWKKNNKMIDYFLLHHFLSIVLDKYDDEWKRIVPISNSIPHILWLRFFEEFDSRIWESLKNQTPFHKLSYKYDKQNELLPNTYYRVLFDQ